jgi:hypothetical protein
MLMMSKQWQSKGSCKSFSANTSAASFGEYTVGAPDRSSAARDGD